MLKYLFFLSLILSHAFASATEVLDTVTIKANKVPTKFGYVPAKVQVNTLEEIEKIQASQIGDIFKDTQNVTATSGPRFQAEMPQIRGLDSKRILILIDDARQNLRTTHNGGLILDPVFLRRVEVISGPSSVIYGSGAIAGIISFETLEADDLLLSNKNQGLQLQTENHSVQHMNANSLLAYSRKGAYDILFGATDKKANDIKLSDNIDLKYSAFESNSYLFKVTRKITPEKQLSMVLNFSESQSFTPLDPSSTIDGAAFLGDDQRQRESLTLQYRSNTSNKLGKYHITSYYGRNEITKIRQSDQRKDLRQTKTIGFDYNQYFDFAKNSEDVNLLSYGLEFFQDTNDGHRNGSPLSSFPDGTGSFYGLYLQYQKKYFDRIIITPGARYDWFTLKTNDLNSLNYSEKDIAFRLGTTFLVNESNTFYFNYAEGFNPPRIQDLFVDGLHFPSNFFIPNTDLKAERSRSFEAGIKTAFESLIFAEDLLAFTYTEFLTHVDNYIYQNINLSGGTTQFINISSVQLTGREASADYFMDPWQIKTAFTQVRSLNESTNQPVSDSPADQFSLNIKYNFPKPNLYIGYRGAWQAEQNRIASNELLTIDKTPSYNVHDIYTGWTFKTFTKDDTQFQLRINNIFNTEYRVHASIMKAPAKDVRLALKIRF